MKIEYDHKNDILYIRFSDYPHGSGKRIDDNVVLDFDENGSIRAIQIMDARRNGINPLSLVIEHYTETHDAPPITEAEQREFEAAAKEHKERVAARQAAAGRK